MHNVHTISLHTCKLELLSSRKEGSPAASDEVLGRHCAAALAPAHEVVACSSCHHEGIDVRDGRRRHDVAAQRGAVAHLHASC